MTSPTAMSSLFFGFATYGFLAGFVGRSRDDGGDFGNAENDVRGARDQVERDVGGRERLRLERP